MTRIFSLGCAALAALALCAAPAHADDHGRGWGRGGGYGWKGGHHHKHGHGHGHGWAGHSPYYRGYYRGWYPRSGYVVGGLPYGYTTVTRWGSPYYYGAGAWYRPYGPRFVVVAPPLGLVVPYLPPYYTTVVVGGVPYYCAGDTYYQSVAGGYAVVAAPQGYEAGPQSVADYEDDIFVYPRRGQSESRQSDDRYECHRWAVDQTGFDPTRALEGAQEESGSGTRSDYQRAMTACLEGRGYTVR
jgi:hypothetical protein